MSESRSSREVGRSIRIPPPPFLPAQFLPMHRREYKSVLNCRWLCPICKFYCPPHKTGCYCTPNWRSRGIFVDTRRGIECKSERHRSNIAPGQSPVSEYINMRLIIVPQAISIDRVSLPSSNGSCPIVPIPLMNLMTFSPAGRALGSAALSPELRIGRISPCP